MGSARDIMQMVRKFLFSSVNREFLTFLFFLALSGVFWLMMTLNETYEREVEIPVRIVNVPKNVVLTSDEHDTLKVTLRDKGLTLLGYLYGEGTRTLSINFKTYAKGDGYSVIPTAELQRLIYQQLSASTKIVGSKPDRLELYFNYGMSKRVPVRWTGRVIPEQLYFISHVEYFPDSVSVYASKQKLDSIRVLYTEPLNYANFRDTLSVSCRLQKIKGVKAVPDKIKVAFHTDVLTEESIKDIPIKGVNMPAGKVLRTFPSKVTVRFVTGVSQFRSIRPEDFVVVADYNDIKRNPSDKCSIRLKSAPNGISRPQLNISQVDYLIEEE